MNSKFEKWNELPSEMRLECVQWMDFKSRMMLRSTSHTEMGLIESAPKIHFDSVKVELDIDFEPNVTCKQGSVETIKIQQKTGKITPEFIQKARYLALQLMNFAAIDHFEYWDNFEKFNEKTDVEDPDVAFLYRLHLVEPMKFKSLLLQLYNRFVTKVFLKQCSEITEKLVLDGFGFGRVDDREQYIDFSAFPFLYKAKTVQFKRMATPVVPFWIVEQWCENDAELGTTIQAHFQCRNFVEFFADKMPNRVVSKSTTNIRLKTDNPAKHVLIRVIPNMPIPPNQYFFSFLVIPADQKELFSSSSNGKIRVRTDNPAKHILIRKIRGVGSPNVEYFFSFLVIPADQKESEYEKKDQWARSITKYQLYRDQENAESELYDLQSQIAQLETKIKEMEHRERWASDESDEE